MNYDSFIISRRPEYTSPSQTVPLLFCVICCHENLCLSKRCLANSLPLPVLRRCLPNSCLVNGHIPSQYVIHIFPFIHQLRSSLWNTVSLSLKHAKELNNAEMECEINITLNEPCVTFHSLIIYIYFFLSSPTWGLAPTLEHRA
jgi:hypothetical protein